MKIEDEILTITAIGIFLFTAFALDLDLISSALITFVCVVIVFFIILAFKKTPESEDPELWKQCMDEARKELDFPGRRYSQAFETMVQERAQSKYADRILQKKKIAEENARIARLNEEKRKAQQKEAERKEAERQAFIRAKTKELESENRGIEQEIMRYHELNRKCSLSSKRMSLCNNVVSLLESIEKSSQLSESMAFYNEVVEEKQTIEIKVKKVATLYKNIGNDSAAKELLNRLN